MATAASVPASSRTRGNFFAVMALAIVGVVVYGFSFTFVDNLIHPAYPRPAILYIHAVLFSSWLVRTGQVATHRRLGSIGIGLGATMPFVGVLTAIAMTRMRVAHGEMDAAPSSFPAGTCSVSPPPSRWRSAGVGARISTGG